MPLNTNRLPYPAALLGTVDVPILVLALLVVALVVLVVVLWSVKRRRDPRLRIEADAPVPELLPSIAGLTHSPLLEGNAVEVFEDGAFFDALLGDIARATRSVHFETFLWKEGQLGRRMAEALAERSRAGVAVRVMVDANGGKDMGEATVERLVEAGCRFAKYHQGRLRNLGRLNNRDHRKLAVIDGRIGYVGGHCIVDTWLGEAQDKEHFRDLSVRIRGPVVQALQSTFSENWVEETGELFLGEDVFPDLEPAGDVAIHVARIRPGGSASAVKILHHLVLCCAREQILIQNPYFLPDPEAIRALGQAVARGVDVRVMVPSAEASDMPLVQHAAHRNFDALLEAGVRIFEYQRTLLHQKVMTIDGVWCAIGSSNFDDRSFEINDEITLGFYDTALARRLEATFARDLAHCVERTPDEWRRRGAWHRLVDHAAYLLNEQL
jgi:cardiolipin synthase